MSEKAGQIIADFLDRQSRESLRALCELCILDVRKYLARLSAIWPAAIAEITSLQSLDAVAYDVVGEMLASKPGRMAYPIQDFFLPRIQIHGAPISPDELYFWFRPFLRKFTRQSISRLRHEEESQAENLKRRFRETLRGPEFALDQSKGNGSKLCHCKKFPDNLRSDKPHIEYARLLALVEDAFLNTTNRTDWCREIFRLLNELGEYRNAMEESWILRAIVNVNTNYVNMDGIWHGSSGEPESDRILRIGAGLVSKITDEAKRVVLWDLVSSGRIKENEAEKIAESAKIFLTDWLAGGTDPLPEYFRLTFAEDQHSKYLERYKYPFERTLSWCKDMFISELGENL